jgi:hypothetical protein
LALTSPTSGGRSVGIVRLRITATEFSFLSLGGRNLLIGNHYFAPDVTVDIIKNYLNFLENIVFKHLVAFI